MEKPQLSNFGLNEQSLAQYEKQLQNYKDAEHHQHSANIAHNEIIKRKAIIISIVFAVIWAIIMFIEIKYYEGELPILGMVIYGLAIISPLIFTVKKEGAKGLISGLIFLLFPFIGLGQSIIDCYERKDINIEKSKYIDNAIEQKVHRYQSAIEKYKDVTDKTRPTYWDSLTALQFEQEVASLYALLGYSAIPTRASGDGGVDIILHKEGQKIGVQCKHWSKPVGPEPVRSLIGVSVIKNCNYVIFVSLNGFTSTVFAEAQSSSIRVVLVKRSDLCAMAESIK